MDVGADRPEQLAESTPLGLDLPEVGRRPVSRFAVGQRVVVLEKNGYDDEDDPSIFGVMAGHYGKVVYLGKLNDTIVSVDILGHVSGGELAWGLEVGGHEAWPFFESELEHVD